MSFFSRLKISTRRHRKPFLCSTHPGFKQLDQWLLKELLFPEQSTFAIRMNTLFGFIILNIIFNQVFLDPLKLTLQILSEEIKEAAAPHLGATALQLLNHTAQVWTALRSGLDK